LPGPVNNQTTETGSSSLSSVAEKNCGICVRQVPRGYCSGSSEECGPRRPAALPGVPCAAVRRGRQAA